MLTLLLCFLLPLLGAIRISFIGESTLAEPIVAIIGIFSLRGFLTTKFRIPVVKYITILGALWLLGQVGSDLYRNAAPLDYLRGWLKITVLLCSFITYSTIVGTNIQRIVAVYSGTMMQPVLNYALYRPDLPLYKFVVGIPISFFAFILAARIARRSTLGIIFPVGAGILALIMDCRSLAGITLSSAMLYGLVTIGFMREERSWRKRLVFAGLWGALSISILSVYSSLAKSGNLGEQAQDKYEEQSKNSGSFSILSGRSEVYFSVPKILQSPIIGWGSWATDIQYVSERAAEMGENPELVVAATNGLIPTHSHLFGAWLEAGIFGAIFWGYVLYLGARTIASGWLSMYDIWCGAFSYILITFLWDILFSPFGGDRRVSNGLNLWLVALTFILATAKRKALQEAALQSLSSQLPPQFSTIQQRSRRAMVK